MAVLIGAGEDYYAIWSWSGGPPIETFPLDLSGFDEVRRRAWQLNGHDPVDSE
jgi:hypothetical protein